MFIPVNGNNYYMEVVGEGPPLLLLHGFTGSVKTWSKLADDLTTSFTLIMIDLPGHGGTIVKEPFSMESTCADIAYILEYMKLEKVHILGYSMGGRTALSFSMLYQEKVNCLLLESASPGLQTNEERKKRREKDKKLAEKIESEGIESFVDFWESIQMFQSQTKLPNKIRLEIQQERLNQSPIGLAESLRGMGTGSQPSWWQEMSNLDHPTLLITGGLDEKFFQIACMMEQTLLNATHITVKNTGHAIHVEEPRIFGKIVSDFILNNESTIYKGGTKNDN